MVAVLPQRLLYNQLYTMCDHMPVCVREYMGKSLEFGIISSVDFIHCLLLKIIVVVIIIIINSN